MALPVPVPRPGRAVWWDWEIVEPLRSLRRPATAAGVIRQSSAGQGGEPGPDRAVELALLGPGRPQQVAMPVWPQSRQDHLGPIDVWLLVEGDRARHGRAVAACRRSGEGSD